MTPLENRLNNADLILKHLRDELSATEQQELQAWLDADEKNRELFAQLTDEALQKEDLKFFEETSVEDGLKKVIAKSGTGAKVIPIKQPVRRWWMAAAAVIILALAGTLYFILPATTNRVNTRFAETKQLMLPDASVVTLNANSGIEYKKEWKTGRPREVWLKGEAFFEVNHLNDAGKPVKEEERFIVHTGNLKVEVLGTSFNVSTRNGISKVVLQNGIVQIYFNNKQTGSVMLQPGEMVKYSTADGKIEKESVAVEKFTAWKQKELILNNTTVRDLVELMENTFGYTVEVEDKAILNRQISAAGSISLQDEKSLFTSLELILNVEIKTDHKNLLIRNR